MRNKVHKRTSEFYLAAIVNDKMQSRYEYLYFVSPTELLLTVQRTRNGFDNFRWKCEKNLLRVFRTNKKTRRAFKKLSAC